MKLRAAALLFTSVLGLLVVGIWLCFQLLGAGLSAAQQVTGIDPDRDAIKTNREPGHGVGGNF